THRYQDSLVRVTIPAGVLSNSIPFEVESSKEGTTHRVGESVVPLFGNILLAIKVPKEFDSLPSHKLSLARVDEKGRVRYAGGSYKNGWIEGRVGSFGNYMVVIDTLPPTISTTVKDNMDLTGREYITFKIKDQLSGIASYKVTIDGKWILSSYDPKTQSLRTELKSDKIGSGDRRRLEIEVVDNRGNRASFFWYIRINF
ncbi:MAG: hypothetical protein WC960_06420, partial [Bacteroidales bacterium]